MTNELPSVKHSFSLSPPVHTKIHENCISVTSDEFALTSI